MQSYVGLDVSLRQTAVCVVGQSGKVKRDGQSPSAERTVGPARIVTESLTQDPELESSQGH